MTIQNCGAQLVHMRDNTVESVLGVLDKLEAWFHPNHYILMEIKMVIVKDWGDKVVICLLTSNINIYKINMNHEYTPRAIRSVNLHIYIL